jgi:hypothetical protein
MGEELIFTLDSYLLGDRTVEVEKGLTRRGW